MADASRPARRCPSRLRAAGWNLRSVLYGAVFGLAVVAQARAQTTPAAGAPPTTEQPTSVSPYRVPLVAFGRAYVFTTQDFLEPLPGKVLILRALHGLASDPRLAAQAQQQVLAAAINKAETSEPTDDRSLLRTFGDSVERLHGLAGGPSVEAIIERALEGMLNGLDGETAITGLRSSRRGIGRSCLGGWAGWLPRHPRLRVGASRQGRYAARRSGARDRRPRHPRPQSATDHGDASWPRRLRREHRGQARG